jgi:antirestriction protein ArdC
MATTTKPEILDRLTQGVAELTTSEAWTQWLDTQRRFHSYSFYNCMLIQLQRPDATRVAGFRTWLSMNRNVRKGERGISILAPIVRRTKVEDERTGEQVVFSSEPFGFRTVHVFDVSQTHGTPLQEGPCRRLSGDDPDDAFERLESVAALIGYSVDVVELPGERNGDCAFSDRSIRVRAGLAPAQMVKTLAHELGHALMHDSFPNSRSLAELEAESVAYVVCDGLGLDSGEYSFGYVATWAGGSDAATKAITESANRIHHAAKTILSALDAQKVSAA